jgi:site-specific recombinase XerC
VSALAPTLEAFFTERLIRQRQASPNTIAAYRDTLKLLLCFAAKQTKKQPGELETSASPGSFHAELDRSHLSIHGIPAGSPPRDRRRGTAARDVGCAHGRDRRRR